MNQSNKLQKIYFASDQHFGIANSRAREILFVQWLDRIRQDATALYLLGDLFDFWFEYKTVVPRGYVRVLGKLAELRDAGLPIYYFVGNHDLWMKTYFEEELGIPVFHKPMEIKLLNHHFFIGHGDGLGPNDTKYKLLKKVFTNPICQWLFGSLHPNWAFGLANYFSYQSKLSNEKKDADRFLGADKEFLVQYCRRKIKKLPHIQFFIFGHRHLMLDINIAPHCRYLNLGDWLQYFSYAVYDGNTVKLKQITKQYHTK